MKDKDNSPEMPFSHRALTARPDTVDFRDLMYVPTLVEVPSVRPLNEYTSTGPLILDQGQEGACTGFALAAVANHLLYTRKVHSDPQPVSSRMLYEMAKRHDEWEGVDYEGSSARGAMKGWHKFGVCSDEAWPYRVNRPDLRATAARLEDARRRPLGAYFRVNHRDLVSMHSAISETGILYATAMIHEGWDKVSSTGVIKYHPRVLGGHAFALVGYDSKGFWLQNSWGDSWGMGGFAHIAYDDWLENGSDVWVARLGAPIEIDSAQAYASSTQSTTRMSQSLMYPDLRPHIISLGNDGMPSKNGDFANSKEEIRDFVKLDFPRITANWKTRRILLYAHGGLVSENNAVQRVAEYRAAMLKAEVYPIAFVWNSDFWTTLKNILADSLNRRRAEGVLDKAKDFMLDRLDDTLEPIARSLTGKAQWAEMRENAVAASSGQGGAKIVLEQIKALLKSDPSIEIHVAGHSAGSILMGPVVKQLAKFTPIQTCHLWAPACTIEFFRKHYLPLLSGSKPIIRNFALYSLTDQAERDDHCANIYNKSLLYLVSRALEEEYKPAKWGWKGAPILGMEKFIRENPDVLALFKRVSSTWVLAPNHEVDTIIRSSATTHGGFDDDPATVKGSLERMLGNASAKETFEFERSASSVKDRRKVLDVV